MSPDFVEVLREYASNLAPPGTHDRRDQIKNWTEELPEPQRSIARRSLQHARSDRPWRTYRPGLPSDGWTTTTPAALRPIHTSTRREVRHRSGRQPLAAWLAQALNDHGSQHNRICHIFRHMSSSLFEALQTAGLDAHRCDCCGKIHFTQGLTTIISYRTETSRFCVGCRDNHCFFCDRTEEYYSRYQFTAVSVDDGHQTVCLERCQDEIYYWDSDGEYHSDPYDPDEDTEECGSRRAYHCDPIRNSWAPPRPGSIGVEIETKASDLDALCELARSYGYAAEEDGSLDARAGVEIITPTGQWPDLLDQLAQFCDEARQYARGFRAGTGYGMHVSLCCSGMTRNHVDRIQVSINSWRAQVEKIAGREETHWAKYYPQPVGPGQIKPCPPEQKYQAAAMRSDTRLEIRPFRAALNADRVRRNVLFCIAVRDWCEDHTSVPPLTPPNFAKFLDWLADKPQFKPVHDFFSNPND